MKVITFEKLAKLAIKREIKNLWHEMGDIKVSLNIFKTEINEKGVGRTVTVWFETQCENPVYWDVMPVTIIYKSKLLTLGDICERTNRFFMISASRLQRKYCQQLSGELNDF